MKAGNICGKAAALIGGERNQQHGALLENQQNVADHWNAYLKGRLSTPITALDVALMMVELKVARTKLGSFNLDDYVDIAGYGAVAGEIADQAVAADGIASRSTAAVVAEAAAEPVFVPLKKPTDKAWPHRHDNMDDPVQPDVSAQPAGTVPYHEADPVQKDMELPRPIT